MLPTTTSRYQYRICCVDLGMMIPGFRRRNENFRGGLVSRFGSRASRGPSDREGVLLLLLLQLLPLLLPLLRLPRSRLLLDSFRAPLVW
jgi:hypothetical protein